jgi:hypothetical protein
LRRGRVVGVARVAGGERLAGAMFPFARVAQRSRVVGVARARGGAGSAWAAAVDAGLASGARSERA